MDVEIIIENDHESLITTTILKSKENKNVEVVPSACEKKRKKGVFNPQWLLDSQVSSFLREYKLDSTKILCIACNETFSIHYGGKNDIGRHIKLKRHINNMKSFNINRQLITSTMKPNKEIEETAAAEGAFVYHGVKRGHSYLSQQCITNVLKTIFSSSSAIAKSMSCGRTKCNSIAVNVLAPRFTQKVLTEVKEAYFYSIMFDASNKGNIKFFPVCVQYFSKIGVKKGCIIDLIDDADELATNIFENLMTVIKKSDLPFDGLTSIGADNTNVNMGNNHTVYTLFNNEIENLFKEYVDKYFSQNVAILEAIGHFCNGIENLTWNHIQKCIELTKIEDLNEDNLFNEFTELKLTFEIIKKKQVPLFDQIQFFLSNEQQKDTNTSLPMTIRQNEMDEEDEEDQTKVIRSDQLWAMLFAVNATPTPNMKKLICFLYSIPASNAYVECVFSDMKHLLNDSRNRMSVESIAAELRIRRNGSISCIDMHKYLLSQKELLEAISSNNKYTFKKQRID
ncbi:unnamed protein product [Rotaria magnacalcarata]|uniref:HAT C-terminal dimerisation domain-containing protein n=2 Tax=Rotaria magnacalcarata TaxID=392030 RepID=A0A8S2MGR9_9BILA|nr:unnamed protein product [Rotaria magnacalcarata]